jgi:hypothetical protein
MEASVGDLFLAYVPVRYTIALEEVARLAADGDVFVFMLPAL